MEVNMKIIAINGSPRKNWNTHILLQNALDGAASTSYKPETGIIHLYDIDYKGCRGCLECKRKDGKSLGRCAIKDGLEPILKKLHEADGIILGSPIYLSEVTGQMRTFLERFLFQYLSYDIDNIPRTPHIFPSAFIYTMNIPENILDDWGYTNKFLYYKSFLERVLLGKSDYLIATETLQMADYGKYYMSKFNEKERIERRKEVFPKDCEKAYKLGAWVAENIGI
jgi:multimeric flavodoxin WrbA